MALDNEELNRRRQERELRRAQQKREQRSLILKLCLVALVMILCTVGIILLTGRDGEQPRDPAQSTDAPPAATTKKENSSTKKDDGSTVIHIRMAGDLNVTDAVVNAGLREQGYDFTTAFQDVAAVLSDADVTMLNLEGNFSGYPYGTDSSSAPEELADALRAAGVDIVQVANSCTLNNSLIGLQSTIRTLQKAGLEPTGAYATPEEFRENRGFTMCEVRGVKVAVVAFTKGMGRRAIPAGNEDCVNLLYTDYATTYQKVDTDFIKSIMKDVRSEDPDVIVALLHWGSEYNDSTSASQDKIVKLLQGQGANVILGTHPHMVHKIEYNREKNQLIAWSLGDFFGDAEKGGTNYSIILDVEITMDNETGKTKVTGYSYIPVYTLKENECDGQRRVVRIKEAMQAYESGYVDRITTSAYESMKKSLERIEARVAGKY